MSGRDAARDASARLPGLDARPGFDEPWQAALLAIAETLIARGLFGAGEWSAALGAERQRDADAGEPDDQAHYYEAALRALETLTLRAGALTEAAIDRRQARWQRAYRATPHGDPVRLEAGGTE